MPTTRTYARVARNETRATAQSFALALAILMSSHTALAQRTDDNVTAESDDAFGRSVGGESLGIYNPGAVRGFSPIDAGNVRMEGLYFDQQTDPDDRLVAGSAIRVGIAAQGYPFPSPTGIVDYDLRQVGKQRVVSPAVFYGPFDGSGAEFDAQVPLRGDTFGVAFGAGYYRDAFEWGGLNRAYTVAVIPQWKPTANIELRPFYSRVKFGSEEPQPVMLMAGDILPPKIRRVHYFGQGWAENEGTTSTQGVLGNARLGDWIVRLGLFESVFAPRAEFADLYTDVGADGFGNEKLIAFQESRYQSRSGELRVSRTYEAASRRHTLFLMARGRLQQRRYGGEHEIDIGAVQLGIGRGVPEPELEFTEQSHDEVRQKSAGVAYELRWKDVGEVSLGFQKTFYTKNSETPLGPLPETRAHPLLKNATATFYATDRLALYGSYTQGLEESPVAPSHAVNRNVAAPALMTKQVDAGVRWTVLENLKLIAGVFDVEKPYFDLDPNGLFTSLGEVRHRGVEFSVAGSPFTRLSLVAGARYLDAEVSGPTVDAGAIGSKPVAAFRTHMLASANYTLGDTGFSIDSTVESISRQMANTANTVEVPGRAVMHVGGRYRFNLFGKPATLRAQLSNIFDRYGWSVSGSGAYTYNAPRRFDMYLAADL